MSEEKHMDMPGVAAALGIAYGETDPLAAIKMLKDRLAAAQAREARLVGALQEIAEAHAEMESTRGMAAKQRWERALTAARAVLTPNGAALAAAITALVDARGSTEELCRLVDALRKQWRDA